MNVFALKEEADKRVHKIKGVQAVSNDIEIAGTNVPDPVLQQNLAKAISYDRVGDGTTPFNAISVSLHERNGDARWSRLRAGGCEFGAGLGG